MPVKFVPYALGEVAYWGEGLDEQQDITRAYGQAGVRISLPFWKVYPTVQSMLFNLNGLAHKVTLVSDLYWADASQNIDEFPLYDPLDDDSQEHFRGYLGAFPWSRDPRNFAFRAGLQSWVASPTLEMVDDVAAARLGIHQRWQTKRGLPGQQRVIDWIVLDVDGTIFPERGPGQLRRVPGTAGIRLPLARGGPRDDSLGRLCRSVPGRADDDLVGDRRSVARSGARSMAASRPWKARSAARCWSGRSAID